MHELGHGLTALMLGGKIHALYLWPGAQIWPGWDWPTHPHYTGFVAAISFSDASDWQAALWKPGLVVLMGSGANLMLAFLAVSMLEYRRSAGLLKYFLVALSLLFLDIFCYTFLPLVGLRHFIMLGGAYPEPLIGARLLGVSDVISIGSITVISLWMSMQLYRSLFR